MSKDTWISVLRDRYSQIKSLLQTKIANTHLIPQFIHRSSLVLRATADFFDTLHRLKQGLDRQITRRTQQTVGPVYKSPLMRQLAPYSGLLVVAIFVLIGNQADQRALAALSTVPAQVTDVKPELVEQILTALDPLTPDLAEEPELVASLLLQDEATYLSRPALAEIAEAEMLSKKDPIPYLVEKGDTLVSIANSNGRTVATILEANNIKPEDAGKLSPGVTLLIPQEDTSTSLAWLEIENKARAEAARVAAERRAKAVASNRALAAGKTTREQSGDAFDGESNGNFAVPIRHKGISRGVSRGHAGIDYRADVGTSVVASANGRVIEVTRGWAGGFGNSVLVDHGHGLTSRYAHLSSSQVSAGQVVEQGELLGYSGNTGNSTGPHLHFEARSNGRVISPF